MNFSATEINTLVGSYVWPLIRIAAVIATAPILGARYIPKRVKIFLAVILTIIIAPTVPAVPSVDLFSAPALVIIAQQLLIGAASGLLLAMVFGAFMIGGEIIAANMGLGFASIIDPQMGIQTPVLSQFYIILMSLVFVSLNGHLLVIKELANSFQTLPISAEGLDRTTFWNIVSWGQQMLKGAIVMALPAVTTLLIVNIALGMVMRAAPQFNILSIGFPVTLSIGLVVMLVSLPVVIPQFIQAFEVGLSALRDIFTQAP